MKAEAADALKVAREALADVTYCDDGVILSLTAHTKRGQQWLDGSTGMHYGDAVVFERDQRIELARAMADDGLKVSKENA
jgi:hypothetical protein